MALSEMSSEGKEHAGGLEGNSPPGMLRGKEPLMAAHTQIALEEYINVRHCVRVWLCVCARLCAAVAVSCAYVCMCMAVTVSV